MKDAVIFPSLYRTFLRDSKIIKKIEEKKNRKMGKKEFTVESVH